MTPSFTKASSLPQALGAGCLIVGSLLVAYASLCLGGELPWHEQVAAGPATADLMEGGAKVNRWVQAGQWYRLATSPLLHGDLIHLLANSLCLALLVPLCTLLVGLGPALACWISGGIAGQLLSLVAGMGTSVGASGGVFALATMAVVSLFTKDSHPTGRPSVPWGLLCAIALGAGLAAGGEGVDHAAHGGGALAGLVMGAALTLRESLATPVTICGAMLGLALAAQGMWGPVLPESPDDVRVLSGHVELALPAVGVRGKYVEGRCIPSDASGSHETPQCVAAPGEMIAVAGEIGAILATDEVARSHAPPPGRCVQYTAQGEQVLLIRPNGQHLMAFATRRFAWDRYEGLRRALRRDRCPNR